MTPTPEDVSPAGERNSPPWEQLDRYIMGEATIAERKEVERWVETSPEGRQIVAHLKAVVQGEGEVRFDAHAGVDVRARIERILSAQTRSIGKSGVGRLTERDSQKLEIGKAQALRGERSVLRTRTLSLRTWYAMTGATAAIALVVIIGVVGKYVVGSRGARNAPMVVYATANGQRANITLSDGSTVLLNVGSRLDVPSDYLSGNHALRLSGEALFTVAKHDGRPFTVSTGQTTAQVLGTSFAVRHYATDTTTTVAVRNGKVMVQSVVVTAARQIEVGRDGAGSVRRADSEAFSFAAGLLTLNSVPLAAAVRELDRWYDADVRLGDASLAGKRLTGEYTTGSVADLANILELTFNVHIERDGKVLTLYAR